MFKVLRLIACLLLCAPHGRAAVDAADFSSGFEKLQALGLPALPEGTRWSTLPDSALPRSYGESYLPRSAKGNGWLLPPDADGHTKLLPACSLTLADLQQPPPTSPGLLGRVLGGGNAPSGGPKPADLDADLKKILTELGKKTDDDSDPFDVSSYSTQSRAQRLGPLLILAAQMHQTGHRAQANQLAAALFQAFPNREAILDSAVNLIANSQYQAATSEFFRTLDWKSYQKSVRSLVDRFPRGWHDQPACALLAAALARRETMGQPDPPQLKDIALTPAALESVRWMLEEKPTSTQKPDLPPEIAAALEAVPANFREEYLAGMMESGSFGSVSHSADWLLQKPAAADAAKDASQPAKPPLPAPPAAATLRLGVAALPVLAALAEDPWLTARPNPGSSSYNYISSDAGPAERALHAYAKLKRPATRGELACALLRSGLPDPDGELSSAEPAVLRDLALEFWKNHRDDRLETIALAFLRDGSSSQKTTAASLIAASTHPDDLLALENHILSDPSPLAQLATVTAILPIRKAAAKPFFDRYVKALRAEVATVGDLEDVDDLPWEIRRMKSIEPLIKQLESQVSGQSAQARAREIAREPDPKAAELLIQAHWDSLENASPRSRLLAMLSGAVAAETPENRTLFLQTLANDSSTSQQADDPQETERKLPPGEVNAWKTLLADTRKFSDSPPHYDTWGSKTLADLAAITMEMAINPGDEKRFQEACIVTGKSWAELALPRAMARVDGNPPPAFPDATKVPHDRLAAIVAAVAAKSSAEIHPYLATLTADERAAWLTWFQKPGDLPIPESALKLSRTVVARWTYLWIANDMPETSTIGLGFEVNRASMQQVIGQLAADATNHSLTYVMITAADFPPGLKILSTRLKLPEKNPDPAKQEEDSYAEPPKQTFRGVIQTLLAPDFPADATAAIAANGIFGDSNSSAESNWAVIQHRAVLQPAVDNKAALLDALDSPSAPFFDAYLSYQVLSRADAEALQKSE